MSKLPILSAKAFEKILLRTGFVTVRQKGSHVFYRHPDGRYTTLPHHKGRDMSRPLIRQILREIDMSPQELIDNMKKK